MTIMSQNPDRYKPCDSVTRSEWQNSRITNGGISHLNGENMKGILIITDKGMMQFGAVKGENGAYFTAKTLYEYCNKYPHNETLTKTVVGNVVRNSRMFNQNKKGETDWYKKRGNFIDIIFGADLSKDGDQTAISRIAVNKNNTFDK